MHDIDAMLKGHKNKTQEKDNLARYFKRLEKKLNKMKSNKEEELMRMFNNAV